MLNFLSSLEIYSHAFLPEAYPDDEEKTSLRKGKERCSYDLSPVHMANLADPTIPSHPIPIQFPCSSKNKALLRSQNKSPHLSRTNDNNKERKKERKRNNPHYPTIPIVPSQPTLQTPSTLKTPFQPPLFSSLLFLPHRSLALK